jgi:small-conductance mechanosensitive channel
MADFLLHLLEAPGTRIVLGTAFLLLGISLAAAAGRLAARIFERRVGAHAGFIARKIVFLAFCAGIVAGTLAIYRIPAQGILAFGGITGIAVGFAAQTSFSNIISGIFLIFERSFRVGDVIRVGDVVGTVLSIDFLSVKVRTVENLFVRIPNESLIKSNVVNLTRFTVRRLDLKVSVAYDASLRKAVEILERAADEHPMVLKKPDPQIFVSALGDNGVEITVRVWIDREDYTAAQAEMLVALKEALDREGIEIPFPHRKILADPNLLAALRGQSPPA